MLFDQLEEPQSQDLSAVIVLSGLNPVHSPRE